MWSPAAFVRFFGDPDQGYSPLVVAGHEVRMVLLAQLRLERVVCIERQTAECPGWLQ